MSQSQFDDIARREITAALSYSGEKDPDELADLILVRIKAHFGGSAVYVPANDKQDRNKDIRESFDGRNHADICQRYCISLATLYRIIGG